MNKEELIEAAKMQGEIDALKAECDALAELNHGQFLQIEYLRQIAKAADKLVSESEEFDFDDGLGKGASQEYWDELMKAMEPATEAIAEAIDQARKAK